jgi:hypothetical protein
MARFGSLGTQYFDNAGDPLISGKIYFKESGTDTDKDTFADVNLSIKNANPVILSGAGRQPNIFYNGSARAILTDSDDVQVEERDPLGGESEEGAFSDWNSITIYNEPDIVVGSDGLFYISITDGNQNNDPTTDAVNWTDSRFIRVWNTNEPYSINRIVEASNGLLYTSLVNNNLGNDPIGDVVNWKSSTLSESQWVAQTKVTTYEIVESDNRSTIGCTGTFTISLPDAAAVVVAADSGDFEVKIKNIGVGIITVSRVTGTDTVDDVAGDITLNPKEGALFKVNTAADGYNYFGNFPSGLNSTQFLRSDATDTASGDLTFSGDVDFTGTTVNEASTNWQRSGTNITASAVEINYNDITTLGTVEASKTVTADANENVTSGSVTTLGAPASAVSVGSLTFPADKEIEAEIVLIGDTGAAVIDTYLEFNGDTTQTNYYVAYTANGGAATQANNSDIGGQLAAGTTLAVKLSIMPDSVTGTTVVHYAFTLGSGTGTPGNITTYSGHMQWLNGSSITSISIRDPAALGTIATGSRMIVRLAN